MGSPRQRLAGFLPAGQQLWVRRQRAADGRAIRSATAVPTAAVWPWSARLAAAAVRQRPASILASPCKLNLNCNMFGFLFFFFFSQKKKNLWKKKKKKKKKKS